MYPYLFATFTYTAKSFSLSFVKRVNSLKFKLDESSGSIIFLGHVGSGGLETISELEFPSFYLQSVCDYLKQLQKFQPVEEVRCSSS